MAVPSPIIYSGSFITGTGLIKSVEYEIEDSHPSLSALVEINGKTVILKWLNRLEIKGLVPGTYLKFSGTVQQVKGKPHIFYPNYDLLVD